MPLSLHAAFVPSCLQLLGSMKHLLKKAEDFCRDNDISEETLLHESLADDMLPFAYQIKSTAVHSAVAIQSLSKGVFSPDLNPPPEDFSGLHQCIDQAVEFLETVDEETLETAIGQPMMFKMGDFELKFTADNFLLSFSQPNFYFHASTAYDILRAKGVKIGKADYMGRMRKL
ncbi:DUF1993 domain-containing protein [Pseudomaricurvus sp.]|uniref:DUF1993 domain-containing protein n=1 Tax=Pseudomaricurvus sp. TaxID=2004510 RepID=UPI003F6C6628